MNTDFSGQLEKARGVSGFSYADFEKISIIPTYRINPEVKANLQSKFAGKFKTDLKIENFHWAIERISNLQKLQSVVFDGSGEATLWQYLDEALFYLRKKKIKSTLRTNGILSPKKSLPDRTVINLHTYLDYPGLREKIEQTISFYRKNRIPVSLVFYIRKNEKRGNKKIAEKLAKETSCNLSASLSYLHTDLICDNCPFVNLTIQPDGNTVSLCRFLPFTTQLTNHLDLREMYEKELRSKIKKGQECLARLS
jgi:MoaA/NifB/PqqE/SkfB family radical SAM enzyme